MHNVVSLGQVRTEHTYGVTSDIFIRNSSELTPQKQAN